MTPRKIYSTLKLDQELTPYEADSERVLEIDVQAPKADQSFHRLPLNLALVLDRSGSMSGAKLDYVKQSAIHVLSLLKEIDRIALVDYDQQVRVLFPSVSLDNETRPALENAIRSIQSGGTTNLSGGWLTGCQEAARSANDTSLNHALLLTDGLANVGVTDPQVLASQAGGLASRGITTSTFGVGADFNHHLLEDMANQGEGRFRFIESPADIPGIFAAEFKELTSILLREVEITLSYPAKMRVAVLGGWRHDCPEPGKLRIHLGFLAAGKSREIFLRLSIPAGSPNEELPLKASLRARGEKGELLEAVSERTIRMTSREEAEAAPKDAQVLERFTQVELADKANEALKLEMQGRRKESSDLLKDYLEVHASHIRDDVKLHYTAMSQRMGQGMDVLDRKRAHFDTYAMKKRLGTFQPYRLESHVLGHLVIDVDGRLVLLDTGSPSSFGVRENWHFMGRHYQLKPSFMGVTPAYLSSMIGKPIDFLVGVDILKYLNFRVDVRNGEVLFSNDPIPPGNIKIALKEIMGIPYTRLMMNGKLHKIFIDTGAKLNYLQKEAVSGLEALDTEKDFYPYLGEFETDVYQVEIEIGGEIRTLRCGVLPVLLEQGLIMAGTEGILGTELFDEYVATFDLQGNWLSLERF